MPRDFIATWNAASKRWFKKINGKQEAVSCSTLAKRFPDLYVEATKEGSYRAANAWCMSLLDDMRVELGKMKTELADWQAKSAKRIQRQERIKAFIAQLDGEQLTHAAAVAVPVLTLGQAVKDWLAGKLAEVSSEQITLGRYDNLRGALEYFVEFHGEDSPIDSVDGVAFDRYHKHLLELVGKKELKSASASDKLSAVKQLLNSLEGNGQLKAAPRNLRLLRIKIRRKAPQCYTVDEIKMFLAACTERTRLYFLLALNCGMTQKDMSDLQHKEVDWKAGTITRKRSKEQSKAEANENVPTVTYRLWPETLRALAAAATKGSDTDLVLLNEDGLALCRDSLNDKGKRKRQDAVYQAFNRIACDVVLGERSFKHLRKTSSTMLKASDHFSVEQLFLGQSEKTIAGRHYSKPPLVRLAEATEWLAEQYGLQTHLAQREAELLSK